MDNMSSRLASFLNKEITVVTSEKFGDQTVVYGGKLLEVGVDYLLVEVSKNERQFINLTHVVRFFKKI